MAEVYFLKLQNPNQEDLQLAALKMFDCFADFFTKDDRVALKIHFGERQSKTYLSPDFVKAIYNLLLPKIQEMSLVDCAVLYKGDRAFAQSHIQLAKDQGFNFAPIAILDGQAGEEINEIEINQKHFKKVKIGKGLENFNSVLAISHFKGHATAGFGGAIKNIGMGFGSKSGKLAMHKAFNLTMDETLCVACGKCAKECPNNAIVVKEKAKIDFSKCLHCGKCISVCPKGAILIPWGDTSSRDLQEKIAEYALGALKGKKAFFVNVLLSITPKCDCARELQTPFLADIGILASSDIVSIDQASLDLAGKENFAKPTINPEDQLNHAAVIGLGDRHYDLIELD